MSQKNLPPLEVGQAYLAADFEKFEYFGAALTERGAILRLHLSNGTTIDLPSADDELKYLLFSLCDAFGPDVIEHLRARQWI